VIDLQNDEVNNGFREKNRDEKDGKDDMEEGILPF